MVEMHSLQINLLLKERVVGTAADLHVAPNRNGMQTIQPAE